MLLRWLAVLLILCSVVTPALAQPRPQVFPLHAAEAGNVNGSVISTFGYPSVTVDNSIAAAWDGVANYEANYPSIGWIAVQCRNQATNLIVTTTTGAASVMCNITGAQQFRARVSGRTVGTVTATAALMSGGESGLASTTISNTLLDDAAFGIGTDRVFPSGFLVDDVASDTADEGDIGAARMSPTRVLRVTPGNDAGTAVTYGAGAVAATTPRGTLASDDPAVVVLQAVGHTRNEAFGQAAAIGGELDDTAPVAATEGNVSPLRITAQRAGHMNLRNNAGTEVGTATDPVRFDPTGTTRQPVDPISGQVGVQGASGIATALTQRVVLATDIALPTGTNVLGALSANQSVNVSQINAVTPLMGNGITGTGSQRVTVASDNTAFTVNVGTFPDNEPFNIAQINGVAPLMGGGVTGTGSPRVSLATDANVVDTELPAAAALADAASATPTTPTIGNVSLLMNATTLDRQRAVVNGLDSVGTGIAAAGIVGQFDDVAPTAITENQFGPVRMSTNRNLYGTLRDAAGNERGANVNANSALLTALDQTTPATTNGITPVPTSNAGAALAQTASGAAESNNVLKASAGNLYSLTVTTGATAGYLMVFNATSAPIDGAVTPAYCAQVPANNTGAFEWAIPARYSTGITAVFSSTGCFTKTASATAAFFAQVN